MKTMVVIRSAYMRAMVAVKFKSRLDASRRRSRVFWFVFSYDIHHDGSSALVSLVHSNRMASGILSVDAVGLNDVLEKLETLKERNGVETVAEVWLGQDGANRYV